MSYCAAAQRVIGTVPTQTQRVNSYASLHINSEFLTSWSSSMRSPSLPTSRLHEHYLILLEFQSYFSKVKNGEKFSEPTQSVDNLAEDHHLAYFIGNYKTIPIETESRRTLTTTIFKHKYYSQANWSLTLAAVTQKTCKLLNPSFCSSIQSGTPTRCTRTWRKSPESKW